MEQEKKNKLWRNYKCWILAVVLLVVSNAGVFYFWHRDATSIKNIDQFRQQYPALDPDRSLYDPKDLIVNVKPLGDQLKTIGNDANVSIYFESLNSGANISVNKDVQIWPASLMKIPLALAAMKKVETGAWSLDKQFVITDDDKNADYGNLYSQPSGTQMTLRDLLNQLLVNSDNTARNVIADNLTDADLDDVLNYLGIDYDYRNNGQITAKRYSIFWRSLFSSTYLKPENSEILIDIMAHSNADDFLGQGIPDNNKFSHKIGVLNAQQVYADSGIVYVADRPFILTVMVENHTQAEAEAIMKDVAQKTYQYVVNY
jgi:beta-lactamase class A